MPMPEDARCEDSFAAIALASAQALDAALAVFLDSEDVAGPHKARVALRRLTTALDAFHPILRRRQTARLRARAKRIFRLLGQVRDSDILLDQGADQRDGKAQRARNSLLREKVRARLRKEKAVAFPNVLRGAVQSGGDLYRRSATAQRRRAASVRPHAVLMLERAWQRCQAYGPSVRQIPKEAHHDFRKDMKTLRYLAEFFSDHFPGLWGGPFRKDLRAIQDALGVLSDHAVASALDGRKAAGSPPASLENALDWADALWRDLCARTPPWQSPLP